MDYVMSKSMYATNSSAKCNSCLINNEISMKIPESIFYIYLYSAIIHCTTRLCPALFAFFKQLSTSQGHP